MGNIRGSAEDARTRARPRGESRVSRRGGRYPTRAIVPPLPKTAIQQPAGGGFRAMNNASSISIIVPVLNEAAHLPASLASVGPLDESIQLIVVDGGSTDDSLIVARRCAAETLVSP